MVAARHSDAAPPRQRGVHGHGRAARELRRHRRDPGCAHDQDGALRSAPHRVDRRRRAGHRAARASTPRPSRWRSACTRRTTSCATRSCPLNATYPLERVQAACLAWTAATRRRVSFEWALIDGVNDRPSDARELAVIARRCGAHVNLIALNPTPGYPTPGTPRRGVVSLPRRARAARASTRRSAPRAAARSTRPAGSSPRSPVRARRACAPPAAHRRRPEPRPARRPRRPPSRGSALGRDLVGELREPPGEEHRADAQPEPAATPRRSPVT